MSDRKEKGNEREGTEKMSEPTIRPKIIKILCQNGEMSKRAVQLMSESDTNKSLQIKDMLEKSLIRKGEVTYSYWDGQKKKQRTETKYTLYHINQNYKEYNHFLYADTLELAKKNLRSVQTKNEGKHKRALRQSEIYTIMSECEIQILKNPLLPEYSQERYCYHDSREIKEYMKRYAAEKDGTQYDINIVQKSRAYGTLYADGEIFTVFDAADKDYIELNTIAERSYHKQSKILLKSKDERTRRIVYAESYNMLNGFLNREITKISGGKTRYVTFLDDTYYEETLLIPKDKMGIKLTYLVSEKGSKKRLDAYLHLQKPDREHISIDCDGILMEGGKVKQYILNFLYPDIAKLKRFYLATKISKTQGDRTEYVVHCYKECEHAVKELIPDAVIVTHSIDKIYQSILQED